ncbi:MAG: caspase family protein [Myxococcota bacterium]
MIAVAAASALLLSANTHAVVVSNNRSLDPARPNLRYADDDGAQWAQLFSETLGDDRVQLLTRFDPESRLLHPEWAQRASAPSRDELDRAIGALTAKLSGSDNAVVYLVFAGHGDIDAGRGFLELEDARFTASDLEGLIERLHRESLGVDRIHVILDSCNSYFMLNPRSASVARWQPPAEEHRSLLAKFPKVGAFISTSAEALTFEWSELQSGVFSYELRSGLRGAADVNRDGLVTYLELEGFVETAHNRVVNELYRPRVFAAAPVASTSDSLLDLNSSNSLALTLDVAEERRLTFRDRHGVRIMDVHKEAGTELTLRLPRNSAIQIQEMKQGGVRPSFEVRDLPEEIEISYLELERRNEPVGDRASSSLFKALFADPYGALALESFVSRPRKETPPFAISLLDAESLQLNLRELRRQIYQEGVTEVYRGIAYGSVPFAIAGAGLAFSGQVDRDSVSRSDVIGLPLGALVSWFYTVRMQSKADALFEIYDAADLDDINSRTQSILAIERKYAEMAEDARDSRRSAGLVGIIGGLATSAIAGGVLLASESGGVEEFGSRATFAGYTALGLVLAIDGIWQRYYNQSAVESMWYLYQVD